LFSFDQAMKVEKTLIETLACQLSCNSCSRLIKQWKLRKLSCKLSLVNSHATLVLVWPGFSWRESWWELRSDSLHESFLNFHCLIKREQELTFIVDQSCTVRAQLYTANEFAWYDFELTFVLAPNTSVVLSWHWNVINHIVIISLFH
jgi:hypothetical protein